MPLYFFKANEKVNMDVYYEVLRYHMLSWLKSTVPTMCLPKTVRRPARRPRSLAFLEGGHGSLGAGILLDFVLTRHELPALRWLLRFGGENQPDISSKCRFPNCCDDGVVKQLVLVINKGSCASVRTRIEAIIQNEGEMLNKKFRKLWNYQLLL
uniref:Putative LOC100197594 [Hydra vulgaris] n=1 Tax=Lepeophtheirus salmonis TaxID=72036 RepID=A0A0K2U1U4_LEPSM